MFEYIIDRVITLSIKIMCKIFESWFCKYVDNELEIRDSQYMFFTKAYRIPSSNKLLNYPMRLYVINNCINGQVYVNKSDVYNVLKLSPIYCTWFLMMNKLFNRYNIVFYFKFPNSVINQLYHQKQPDFHNHCCNTLANHYDMCSERIKNTKLDQLYQDFIKRF